MFSNAAPSRSISYAIRTLACRTIISLFALHAHQVWHEIIKWSQDLHGSKHVIRGHCEHELGKHASPPTRHRLMTSACVTVAARLVAPCDIIVQQCTNSRLALHKASDTHQADIFSCHVANQSQASCKNKHWLHASNLRYF